jgi:hypothetical protein
MEPLPEVERALHALLGKMAGKRVRVYSGDGKRKLGEGVYVGSVPVYSILMPDGSLRSMRNAEQRPPDSAVPFGGKVVESPRSPKIKLDSGRIVYGCQVWWETVEAKPAEAKPAKVVKVASANVRRLVRQSKAR